MSMRRTEHPLTVLIVDDEPAMLRTIARSLERRGHRVHAAQTSAQAMELAQAHALDAALVDLVLGEEASKESEPAGFELCRRLRALPVPPTVVTHSGQPPEAVYIESLRAGAVAHLQKPTLPDQLEACLWAHCVRRQEESSRPPPPFPLQIADGTVCFRGKLFPEVRGCELHALEVLLDHCDQFVSTAELHEALDSGSDEAARQTVYRARRQIGDQGEIIVKERAGFIIRYRSKK
ncbi:MAG TPA: response regulator [Polyangiaceae bacterium]|nr:response regulator [Polyangiaceae bacterium]